MTTWYNVRPGSSLRPTGLLWNNKAFNDPFFNGTLEWAFGPTNFANGGSRQPVDSTIGFRLNVAQDAKNYYVYAVLPGATADKLEISALKNRLTIAGEIETGAYSPASQADQAEGDKPAQPGFKWLHRELPATTAKFHRELQLPTEINAAEVTASFENGILKLVVPQVPQAQAQRIEVAGAPALPTQK